MAHRPKVEILTPESIDRIIDAAYELLARFGVQVKDNEILTLLSDGGARVDFKEQIAYLSADLIDQARATTPGSFSVFSQDLAQEAELKDSNIHFAAGSLPVLLLDSETEIIRRPSVDDLIAINQLIETLEYVDFQTAPILPDTIPAPIQDVFRFFINMYHSNKPYFGGALSVSGMRCQIEMLKVMRGSAEALKVKPRVIFAANPTAPLSWGPIIAHNLVDSARASIPVMLIPMPLPGGTVPVTLAATLIDHTAENLSGIVMAQLANPGAPVLYGGGALLLDMVSGMSCIGAVESHMLGSGYALIGKRLGLPTASNIGQSDSQRVDAQAGLESGIGIFVAALTGINLSRGAGMLNFANCQSFEKLVIDNNICGMAKRMVRGIEVNDETMALEEYFRVGRGGNSHLNTQHTMDHFRQELFFPGPVINRRPAETGKQTRSAFDRAKEEVVSRLNGYESKPMPEKMVKELKALVASFCRGQGIDDLSAIWPGWMRV